MLGNRLENAFFLQCPDSLGTKDHSNLLAIEFEGFLLQIRFKDAVRATQREAHIVAELFTFSS